MAGTVQGPITDLRRANFTDDSDLVKSIIYVRQDQGTDPQFPDKELILKTEYLTNATYANEQNQDGSITPIVFNWTAPQDAILISQFRFIQVGNNINDMFDFANRSALENGLIFRGVRNVGTNIYATVTTNVELIQFATQEGDFSFEKPGNNTQDGQLFVISYDEPILVNSDFSFQVVVQDDLTTLDYQRCTVEYLVEAL